MILEKQEKQGKQIKQQFGSLEKDDFIVIKNLTSKDDFDIGMILNDIGKTSKTVKVLVFNRQKTNFQNFEPGKETKLPLDQILFNARGIKIKDVEVDGHEETYICMSKRKYNQIKERVAIRVGPEIKNQEGDSDSESDNEVKPSKKDIKKLKKSKIKIRGAKKSKTPKKKQKQQYKKGQFNLLVEYKEFSEQLESKSKKPNLDCCIRCNDKEIIRAINNDDKNLVKQLLKNENQISTLNPVVSPKFQINALQYAIQLGRNSMFKYLLEMCKKDYNFGNYEKGFVYEDTGFNDKYAYGFQTKKVQLGRGNQEGNNAFTYDDNKIYSKLIYEQYYYARYLDEKLFNLISITDEKLMYKIKTNQVQKAVIMGNYELSKILMKYCYEKGGFNLNEFHYLALSAQSVEEISHIKRVQVGKKSTTTFRDVTPIHCAAINPNGEILKFLIEVGENLFINDLDMRKPIHYAAVAETDAGLKVLLEQKCDCRASDALKMTPIMYAARAGRAKNIQLMCETVPQNLGMKSKFGAAALHYAAQFNNLEALKELIYQGADVNQTCSKRTYPIMLAAEIGNLEMVEFLLEKGAKLTRTDTHRRSPLVHAVMNGRLTIASLMLQKGADFNQGDSSDNTPLHYACAYGYYEMIPLLMNAGADPNKVNNWNYSPLLVALIKGHMRCVRVLLQFDNVDVNIRDDKGRSFLISLIMKLDPEQEDLIVQLIREKGANLNQRDLAGNTALHVLATKKFVEQNNDIETYMQNLKDEQNFKDQYQKYYDFLIQYNSDINDLNFDQQTPLEIAIMHENFLFVQLALRNKKLKITIPDKKSHTILHSCQNLIFQKNGEEILGEIFKQIGDLSKFQNIYDEDGFNFVHRLMEYYVDQKNWNQKVQQLEQKIQKFSNLSNKCERSKPLKNLKQIKDLINKNINSLINEKENFFQNSEQNFIRILRLLIKNNIDFSKPVQTIFKSIKETYKQQWINYQRHKLHFSREQEKKYQEQENKYKQIINNDAGSTLLHILMKNPSQNIFKLIFDQLTKTKKFQNNIQNYFGETLIFIFCQNHAENFQMLQTLIDIGENPDIENKEKVCPIHLLCDEQKLKSFETICFNKANIDLADQNGENALTIVAQKRLYKHLQILIQNKCHINHQNHNGMNALHIAINYNIEQDTNFDFEECLINNGIDYNSIDCKNRNPIHYFFVKFKDRFINEKIDPIDCFQTLIILKDLQVENQDNYGNTLLHYACQRGAFLCVSKLIKRYSNLNMQNNNKNTPLNMSLIFNHSNIAIMLLQMGCSANKNIRIYNSFAAKQYKQLEQQSKQMEVEENEVILKQKDFNFSNIFEFQNRYSYGYKRPLKSARRKQHFGFVGGAQNDYLQNLDRIYTKEELEDLFKKKFISSKFSTFQHACNSNDDSLKYLIIDNGFPIHQAIKESLELKRPKYCLTLFNKKIDENKQNNDSYFQKLDKKKRNIAHYIAMYQTSNDNDDIFEKIFAQIINKNINLQQKDQNGQTPLHILGQQNFDKVMIEKFIETGLNPLEKDNYNNNLISCILQNKNLQCLQNNNFDNDAQKFNNSPLQASPPFAGRIVQTARKPQLKIPSRSFDMPQSFTQNIYMNKTNTYRNQGNNFQSVFDFLQQIILEFKIDENYYFKIKEKEDETIEHHSLISYSIIKLKNLKLARLFILANQNINYQSQNGETVISFAIKENDPILINFLKEYEKQIDFNLQDKQENSYLHQCVMPLDCGTYENIDLLTYFLQYIDINVQNKKNQTPLDLAIKLQNTNLQNFLESLNGKTINENYKTKTRRSNVQITKFIYDIQFEEDYQNYIKNHYKKIDLDKIKNKKRVLDDRIIGDVKVLKDDQKKPFDIILVKVDIHYGEYSQNLYYKMQIAQDKVRQIYILFTNWGRIGTPGQHQLTPFFSKDQCIQEFKKIFKQKTGNNYDEEFERKTRKYSLVKRHQNDAKYEILGLNSLEKDKIKASQLPGGIQNLFSDIFDYDYIKKIFQNQQIDENLMPFGNLDLEQINKAKIILLDIQDKLQKIEENKKDYTSYELFDKYTEISDQSAEIFELIPMEQNKQGPLMAINKSYGSQLLHKINLLQDITFLKKIFFASFYQSNKINPIDYCFNLMDIGIKQIPKDEDFYQLIQRYFQKEQNYSQYQIKEIFEIESKNSKNKKKLFEESKNKELLVYPVKKSELICSYVQGFKKKDINFSNISQGPQFYLFESLQLAKQYASTDDNDSYLILAEVVLDKLEEIKGEIKSLNTFKKKSKIFKLVGQNQKSEFQKVILKDQTCINIGKFIQNNDKDDFLKVQYQILKENIYIVQDESLIDFKYLVKYGVQIININRQFIQG